MKWLTDSWYTSDHQWLRLFLVPLSLIYQFIIALRLLAYRLGLFKQTRLPIPVIIVGNITVGGTGKTPAVIWLANQLKHAGYQPGIISRGYGGQASHYPQFVTAESDPAIVGDEPVLISQQTQCPMVVSPKRVEAAQQLIQHHHCDIIISDDGLQHYALARDIELVIIDGQRGFGNRYCLPAGPLREPISRLNKVDFIVLNGGQSHQHHIMALEAGPVINVAQNHSQTTLATLQNQPVHAIAGIGHPERFFHYLRQQGINITPHYFADHHRFQASDLHFNDDKPILMTEKDAIKCRPFATDNMWYIPVKATIDKQLADRILTQLAGQQSHG